MKPKKLRTVLILFVSALIILFVAQNFILLNGSFTAEIQQQVSEMRCDVLQQISQNIENITDDVSVVSSFYQYCQNKVVDDISGFAVDYGAIKSVFREADYRFSYLEMDYDVIYAFANGEIFSKEGRIDSLQFNTIKPTLLYRTLKVSSGNPEWVHFSVKNENREEAYIGKGWTIKDKEQNIVGICIVAIPEYVISNTYRDLISNGSSIYIIDNNGVIVSDTNMERWGLQYYNMVKFTEIFAGENSRIIKKSGKEYLYTRSNLNDMPWIVIEEIPRENVNAPIQKTYSRIILASAVSLVLCLTAVALVSVFLTKPVERLCTQIECITTNSKDNYQPGAKVSVTGWSECQELAKNFNILMQRNDCLFDDAKRIEHEKAMAEMNFLKMQIRPHFIYNVLFSTKCMVEMGKISKASEMITCFMKLLKDILSNTGEMIALDEEIENLSSYISIEKMRYGDKFEFIIECPLDYLKYKVPPLILQPIIENAIIHGVAGMDEGGIICLTVEQKEEQLILQIYNNGKTISEEMIKLILERANGEIAPSENIGVSNVHQRIQLNFGKEYGVSIQGKDVGTCVILTLPLIR